MNWEGTIKKKVLDEIWWNDYWRSTPLMNKPWLVITPIAFSVVSPSSPNAREAFPSKNFQHLFLKDMWDLPSPSYGHLSHKDSIFQDESGYGSIPMKIPFLMGWTSIKSQLFWCEQKGYKVLTHCQIRFQSIMFRVVYRPILFKWIRIFHSWSSSPSKPTKFWAHLARWLLLYMEYERQMVATQPSPNGRILVSKIGDITNEDEVWRDHMMGPPASFPYHSYIDTPEEWEVLVTLMGGASNQWKSLQRTLHICQLGTIIAVSGKNGHEWKRVDKCWNHQLG